MDGCHSGLVPEEVEDADLGVDIPVVFYPYDLPIYRERPGFEFDYTEVTPGPAPTDFTDFQNALLDTIDGEDGYTDERERVRKRFIVHPTGSAADRLCQRLHTPET